MALLYEETKNININDFKFIDKIKDRQLNPFYDDKEDFKALYKSIEQDGILTPLVFKRIDENKLELISGRRRLRAIRKINEKNNSITTIPVRIIKQETPDIDTYIYSYNENNIKDPLSKYQRQRAVLFIIYSHSDYGRFIEKDTDIEHILFSISVSLLNSTIKQQNKDKLNEKEQILQKIINEISPRLLIAKNKLINLITTNILEPEYVELLISGITPLSYDDILFAKNKNKKTKKLLQQIKIAMNCKFIEDEEEYEGIKKIATENRLKFSDFYLIDNIDNEYNEEKIEQIDDDILEKFGNNLLSGLAKILKTENEKIENNEENILKTKQTEAKTKFTSIIKKIDERKLDELITYLDGLMVNQDRQRIGLDEQRL